MMEILLLMIMTILLGLIYATVDSFNEDLKQLRILVGHIERHLAQNSGETSPQQRLSHSHNESGSSLINLNTASKGQLLDLPRIGDATAAKIIANRPYETTDELLAIDGINESLFEAIKPLVTTD